jgi:radical SAM protein with 4Fe4S-binding SPASM domain
MKRRDFDSIVSKIFPCLVEIHPTDIGEPLTSEWFGYLCEKIMEYGILFDITTNGMLLNKDVIRKILPNLLDIKISFDGITKGTFEKIRKNSDFDRVKKNIRDVLSLRKEEDVKGTVTLQMTLFDFNYRELPDIVRFAKEEGIDRVKAFHVFSFYDEINSHSLINNPEEFEAFRTYTVNLAKELNIQLEISEPDGEKDTLNNLVYQKCRLLWGECWIDSDGYVYPCHSHGGTNLGNIYVNDFRCVWNSDVAVKLRECVIKKGSGNMCTHCGLNYSNTIDDQAVPYDKMNFLYTSEKITDVIKWSNRSKQFFIQHKNKI